VCKREKTTMGEVRGSGSRALKIFVRSDSKAELAARQSAARAEVMAKRQPPQAEIIKPRPALPARS
jgi:hypothetical protein